YRVIEVGNTEKVARRIAQDLGVDLFHIEQKHPYSANYQTCIQQAQHDLRQHARPELVKLPDHLEDYDEIYLGYPNYWGDAPMAVYSFLDRCDLDGKTIHPFCTHEGSGLGRTVSNLAKAYPQAHFEKGLAIHGSEVDQSQNAIDHWIKN
ncbi:MAG: flavodoxin, partial [Allobaculum sp.]|nr:flavodoxin [Allobaculum sp.]